MDSGFDETKESAENAHTPEEQAAFDERVGEMADYVNLLQMHDDALGEEMYAERERAQAEATNDLDRIRAADRVEERWYDIRKPVWWAIGVLLVGILIAVIAFYGGAGDATPADDGSLEAGESATEAQTGDDDAAGEASGDATDDGDSADAGSAATDASDGSSSAQDTADVAYLLDLASEVVAHTGAANAAFDAGENGEAAEHLMAVKPLMTEYIQGGGDLVMPEFSEAQDEWLWAGNSYVSGNTGALADMEAAYADMVAALERYEKAAASD